MVQHIHGPPRGGGAQQGVAEEPDDALAVHPCAGPWQCQLWPGHRRCRGCKPDQKGRDCSVLKLQACAGADFRYSFARTDSPSRVALVSGAGHCGPSFSRRRASAVCMAAMCSSSSLSLSHATPAMQIMYIGGIWGFSTQVQMWLNHADPTKSDAVSHSPACTAPGLKRVQAGLARWECQPRGCSGHAKRLM